MRIVYENRLVQLPVHPLHVLCCTRVCEMCSDIIMLSEKNKIELSLVFYCFSHYSLFSFKIFEKNK